MNYPKRTQKKLKENYNPRIKNFRLEMQYFKTMYICMLKRYPKIAIGNFEGKNANFRKKIVIILCNNHACSP